MTKDVTTFLSNVFTELYEIYFLFVVLNEETNLCLKWP